MIMNLKELHDHIGGFLKSGIDPNMPVEVPEAILVVDNGVTVGQEISYAHISPLSAYVTPNDDDPLVDRFVIIPANWVEST
jgi:hypothetical protein